MAREKWWTHSEEELVRKLSSDLHNGLSHPEAMRRLKQFGPNTLPMKGGPSAWHILKRQFSNFIVWLLIAAAIVAQLIGEGADGWAIILVVILNVILGFFQEFRAEKALSALQNLAEPHARVIRDGEHLTIPSAQLVPGDLIIIEAGDRLPADGRVISAASLACNESPLTGESLPVFKTPEPLSNEELALGDQVNSCFMGTLVVSGRGSMIVTGTGTSTEIGQIATLMKKIEKVVTPLEKQLEILGRRMTWICLAVVGLVFIIGMVKSLPFTLIVLTSLSLGVAAIPEGLPVTLTIALSIGVQRMAKKKALIRRLAAVEVLGSTSVICTDKTGTLTQNEMTVESFYVNGKWITDFTDPAVHLALLIGARCNHGTLPEDVALLAAAKKVGLDLPTLEKQYPLLEEIPFDSERKWMSIRSHDRTFIKGSPDILVQKCSLSQDQRLQIESQIQQMAAKGLRLLGLAYAHADDWVFTGLVTMRDPPRPEVKEALLKCQMAGIRSVMITGDHRATALAIADELGMPKGDVLTGPEVDALTEDQLTEKIQHVSVFARITAGAKLRIVRAFQKQGHIVAMTGDGVNDAPALEAADIGIAMGQKGNDVTKEAADMVLLSDNFSTIVNAVEEGRGIYDNIIKVVEYLLSSNIAEILIIFFGLLFSSFVPLLPIQLLWVNIITDGFPAVGLAFDPLDRTAMQKRPRPSSEKILSKRVTFHLFYVCVLMAAGALFAFFWGLRTSQGMAQTMTFTALILLELVHVKVIRSEYQIGFFSNPWLLNSIVISLGLQLLVIYVPQLQPIFGTEALGLPEWGVLVLICFAFLLLSKIVSKLWGVNANGSERSQKG